MKKFVKLLILCLLLVSAGCIPSANPLYTEKDIIFDAAILGSWTDGESGETWEIVKAGDKTYKVIQTERDGTTNEFSARLLKINDQTFLNLTSKGLLDFQTGIGPPQFLPSHFFIRLSRDGSTFRASTMDPDWLKTFLEKNPASIRHQKLRDEMVLIASTVELQKFVLDHLETPGAFTEPVSFKQKGNGK